MTARTRAMRRLAGAAFGALATLMLVGAAPAAAENRTLDLYNTHTKERLTITFKKNGRYVQSALTELNRFLRDWRRNEPTNMDPRLFDTVWEVYTRAGARQPIHVVSAYRSANTNNMLRSRSKGVAKHSQHTLGKAMDFYLPGVKVSKLREIGISMQRGGVGYYPSANNPFVHIDVGSVRAWPRMSRTQLTKIFPDGKTVHLPADGKPLAGYQQALAELKRNGSVTRPLAIAEEGGGKKPVGLLAMLFGGDSEDETEELNAASGADEAPAAAPAPARTQPAPAAPVVVAAAPVPPRAPDAPVVRSLADATLPAGAALAAPTVVVASVPPPPAPRGRPKDLDKVYAALELKEAETAALMAAAAEIQPRPRPEAVAVAAATPAVAAPALGEPANARMALAEVVRETETEAPTVLGYASPIDTRSSERRPQIQQAALTVGPMPKKPATAPIESLTPLADEKTDQSANPLAVLTAPPASIDLPVYDAGQSTYWGVFASLTHPDQRTVSTLFTDPSMVVMTNFTLQPYAGMSSMRFAGEALPSLPVLMIAPGRDFAQR